MKPVRNVLHLSVVNVLVELSTLYATPPALANGIGRPYILRPTVGSGRVYWSSMLSAENNRRGREPAKETKTLPDYCRAVRYGEEPPSAQAYFQAQNMLADVTHELSSYRFQLDQIWHVAVLGDRPPAEFDQQIASILAAGEPTTLPSDILILLNQRRLQAATIAPWVEGHYRPGKRVGR